MGGNCLKRGGLGQFADLRGKEVGKKQGGLFLRGWEGWYPNAQYELDNNFNCDFKLLMSISSVLISNKKRTILQLIGY